jgi:hypothetical protein
MQLVLVEELNKPSGKPMHQPMNKIVQNARRVAYTPVEMNMAVETTKMRKSKGTDLRLGHPRHVTDAKDFAEAAAEGIIFMHSPEQLSTCFMFVKLDGGRSLFGRQKAVYASYMGDLHDDAWATGPVFKSWGIATTSIGNIYRGNGFR